MLAGLARVEKSAILALWSWPLWPNQKAQSKPNLAGKCIYNELFGLISQLECNCKNVQLLLGNFFFFIVGIFFYLYHNNIFSVLF